MTIFNTYAYVNLNIYTHTSINPHSHPHYIPIHGLHTYNTTHPIRTYLCLPKRIAIHITYT